MPTEDQLQRFTNELLLFKGTVKNGPPLTRKQWQALKLKLYDLIFEVESTVPPSLGSGPPAPN